MGNRRILNLIGNLSRNFRSRLCDNFARNRAHNILRKNLPVNAVSEKQFLIKFVTPYFRQVIPSRVKEHAGNQALCTVNSQWLSRTDLFIKLQKAFLVIRRRILFKTCKNLRLFPEDIYDLRIRADTKRSNQYSNRHLSCSIYSYIKNVIGIRLIFQPRSAVWNNSG